MLGVIVNSAAVIVGTILGLILNKVLKDEIIKNVSIGLGVCIALVGLYTIVKADFNNTLTIVVLLSFTIGTIVGYYLKIDKGFEKIGSLLQKAFKKNEVENSNKPAFSEGFVQATMTFCVGAMVIYGSISAGLGDNSVLYIKAVMDGITAMVLTIKFGPSVILSAVSVFLIQGLIVLLSNLIGEYLNSCESFKNALNVFGGIFVLMIGINMLEIKKINIAIMLPALLGTIYFLIVK